MLTQREIQVDTRGRGSYEISGDVQSVVRDAELRSGMCHVFIRHTSASLMLCENADPAVLRDLETFMSRTAPDGDPMFTHTAEGPDDMPAHIKASLMGSSVTIPITAGRLNLGTWQGIYLCEHRDRGGQRRLVVTVMGG